MFYSPEETCMAILYAIDDETCMEVQSHSITFRRKTPSLPRRAFLFVWFGLALFLLGCFSLLIILLVMELFKMPSLLVAVLLLSFSVVAIVVFCFVLWCWNLSQAQSAVLSLENGVLVYTAIRGRMHFSKTLQSEDYVFIDFVQSREDYGIAVTLSRHLNLMVNLSRYTIVEPIILGKKGDALKTSLEVEMQIRQIFPNLKVINNCSR